MVEHETLNRVFEQKLCFQGTSKCSLRTRYLLDSPIHMYDMLWLLQHPFVVVVVGGFLSSTQSDLSPYGIT